MSLGTSQSNAGLPKATGSGLGTVVQTLPETFVVGRPEKTRRACSRRGHQFHDALLRGSYEQLRPRNFA
jgi:hypothetical protein